MSTGNTCMQEWKWNNRKYLRIYAAGTAGTAMQRWKVTSLALTGASWCCLSRITGSTHFFHNHLQPYPAFSPLHLSLNSLSRYFIFAGVIVNGGFLPIHNTNTKQNANLLFVYRKPTDSPLFCVLFFSWKYLLCKHFSGGIFGDLNVGWCHLHIWILWLFLPSDFFPSWLLF